MSALKMAEPKEIEPWVKNWASIILFYAMLVGIVLLFLAAKFLKII